MDMQAHRDIGKLQGQVEALEKQVASMAEKLDAIHNTITSTKGGWKMIMAIIGVTATVTGVMMNLGKIFGWLAR